MLEGGLIKSISQRVNGNISSITLLSIWTLVLLLLGLGVLGSWNLIKMPYNDFTLGIFMMFGGVMILFETYLQQGFDTENASVWIGTITGLFGTLYGVGLVTEIPSIASVTGGVQGGILVFMFVNLLLEGISNHEIFE